MYLIDTVDLDGQSGSINSSNLTNSSSQTPFILLAVAPLASGGSILEAEK